MTCRSQAKCPSRRRGPPLTDIGARYRRQRVDPNRRLALGIEQGAHPQADARSRPSARSAHARSPNGQPHHTAPADRSEVAVVVERLYLVTKRLKASLPAGSTLCVCRPAIQVGAELGVSRQLEAASYEVVSQQPMNGYAGNRRATQCFKRLLDVTRSGASR